MDAAQSLVDVLRGELERWFDLDELRALARDVLALDPDRISSASARAAFAEALVLRSIDEDRVEALCDAIAATRDGVDARLEEIRTGGYRRLEPLGPGVPFGPFQIDARLGTGAVGTAFVGRHEGKPVRLKVLSRHLGASRASVERYLARSRAAGSAGVPGVPKLVLAGDIEGRTVVAHELVEGRVLADRLDTKPLRLGQAWPVLRGVLDALIRLHSRRLVHGSLRPGNVLVTERGTPSVWLLDIGTHFLLPPTSAPSPEQIRGEMATARSDAYGFGALVYELVCGRPVFAGTPAQSLQGHLADQPDPPSFAAPRGWVEPELDELVLELLDKRPERRPADLEGVLEVLGTLASRAARRDSRLPSISTDEQVSALLANPEDEVAAAVLESVIDRGADPHVVAEAFLLASEQVSRDSPARRRLVHRAAALLETAADDPSAAERAYRRLLDENRDDEAAWAALERLHRRSEEHDKLVELLVERSEHEKVPSERARVLAKMGDVLRTKLDDPEQALVAYVQAFCEHPMESAYAAAIESLVAPGPEAWTDVLASCTDAVMRREPSESRNALLAQMGRWFMRAGRADRAQNCFQAVLLSDPTHDVSLAELAGIHRKTQEWKALCLVLEQRADGAVTAALARDLRVEAASVLEQRLGDRSRAIALYEQVVSEDPGHPRAAEALVRLYTEARASADLVRTLERWALAATGAKRLELLMRLADAHEHGIGDAAAAASIYESVLTETPGNLDALAGLERVYSRLGRHVDLRTALLGQLEVAPTPRQKVVLLERLAALQAREFLDPDAAAAALERLVEIEPTHLGALGELAVLYEKLGRWEALVRTLDRHTRALPSGPQRIATLLSQARVFEEHLNKPEAAIAAYETVLGIDASRSEALDRLARLRAGLGDEVRAAQALDSLAALAGTPEGEAAHYVRAGELLEKHGDIDGAIERYRNALDASPAHEIAAARLRAAYVARGDVEVATRMLEDEVANAASPRTKVKLGMELAQLLFDRSRDRGRAEAVAERVLEVDPTNVDARVMLGDIARSFERHAEAVTHYDVVVRRLSAFEPGRAVRVLGAYADALARTGAPPKALAAVDDLLARFPDSFESVASAADVVFRCGTPERAALLQRALLDRWGAQLGAEETSRVTYRLGESLRRAGRLDDAVPLLEEAARLDTTSTEPLRALAAVFEAKAQWVDVTRTLLRQLERASADERVELLVGIGDLASRTLHDPNAAAESYLKALAERPTDRKILLKLVQLYTTERDWSRLVGAIEQLASVAQDAAQGAQHLLVAARVAFVELGDRARGLLLVDRALGLAPTAESVVREAIALKSEAGDTEGLRLLLEQQIEAAAAASNRERALELGTRLADLHLSELHVDEAIAVNEAILRIGGDDPAREDTLFDLYASDPTRYLERAVTLQERVLRRDPYRPEPYRSLLKLYTDVKNRDAAWCACQALAALDRAASDEELYFKKHRSSGSIPGDARLTEDDWQELVVHRRADPLLTSIFSRIQPAVLAARATTLEQAGYSEKQAIDPKTPPSDLVGVVARVSEMLRMRPPLLIGDPTAPGALTMARTDRRCLVIGRAGLGAEIPPREGAYLAAAYLTYFRPGLYVRSIVPTVAGLKAWMLAAIRLIAPRMAVAAELEGAVLEAHRILEEKITGSTRDWLAQPVTELLRRGEPADVARWMAGVDFTSDRVGLIACGDLSTVLGAIRAHGDAGSAAPAAERSRQLLAYSVSHRYLVLRERLRLGLDWRQEDGESQ